MPAEQQFKNSKFVLVVEENNTGDQYSIARIVQLCYVSDCVACFAVLSTPPDHYFVH